MQDLNTVDKSLLLAIILYVASVGHVLCDAV